MKVVKFKEAHLAGFLPREEMEDSLWPNFAERGAQYGQRGPAWTLTTDEGKVVASGGAVLLHSKLAEGWVMTTADIEKHALAFHRAFLNGIKIIFEVYKIRRLQIAVKLEWTKAVQWAHRLGFEAEGIMTAFDPDGADYLRLAIVRNGDG
ncbi:MAG: hypothetical protein JRD68_13800 [Deltaproteobacteria bacterium]|nr:hypothetical protein [Deltaproteobacteria bacterium]